MRKILFMAVAALTLTSCSGGKAGQGSDADSIDSTAIFREMERAFFDSIDYVEYLEEEKQMRLSRR